jgi:hypothetical protein
MKKATAEPVIVEQTAPVPEGWEELADLPETAPVTDRCKQAQMIISSIEAEILDLSQEYYASAGRLDGAETVKAMHKKLASIDDMLCSKQHQGLPVHEIELLRQRQKAIKASVDNQSAALFRNDRSLFERWSEWEHILDDPKDPKYKQVRSLFDHAITVEKPFDLKPTLEINSSHVQMNTSRLAGATHAYYKVLKAARRAVMADPTKKVAIVDIGASSFGMTSLAKLKALGGGERLYFHAMAPVIDSIDQDRSEKISNVPGIHYLNTAKVPSKMGNYVSFCRHLCRDCDCLCAFDEVYAISIHAAYEMKSMDFSNLSRFTDRLLSVEHIPEVDKDIPTQKPEYRWERTVDSDMASPFTRLKARAYRLLTGLDMVTLKPLRRSATPYTQQDSSHRVRLGGFQIHPLAMAAERLADNPFDGLKTISLIGLSAGATTFISTPGDLVVRTVCGSISAAMTAAGVVVASRMAHKLMLSSAPVWGTTMTVTVRPDFSVNLAEDHDPLFVMNKYTMRPPCLLTPNQLEQVDAAESHLGKAVASMALAGDTPKSRAQVVATMAREGIPIRLIDGTVKSAARALNYLFPQPPAPPQRLPMPRWCKAAICLPFVWVGKKLVRSILPASWVLPTEMCTAVAHAMPWAMPIYLTMGAVLSGTTLGMAGLLAAIWYAVQCWSV